MRRLMPMLAAAGVLAALALAGCTAPDNPGPSPGETALIRASAASAPPSGGYGGGWGFPPRP